MDFNKLITRYRQFGGIRLIIEYVKIGALLPAIKVGIKCLFKRQSFNQIYPEVLRIIEPNLIERYRPIVQEFKGSIGSRNEIASQTRNVVRSIWFCWLQGFNNAPEIVHACYNSIKRNIPDREIKIIDGQNWTEYVELPEYIVRKWAKGRIPAALFSDLLRLELLIKYGGTWIDSTVLCTGFQDSCSKFQEYLDADLFLFQYTEKGGIPVSISNWFITACSYNEVLMVLRDMLYAYWKDYDCTLDYYIFHLFFSMISMEYPDEIKAMPYGSSYDGIALSHHWGERFDKKRWDKLTSKVCFHKLAFRVRDKVKHNKQNYYNWILATYIN